MAHELVTNGTFSAGLSGWTKSPSSSHYMFVADSGKALAESSGIDTPKRFQMLQSITVTDTVLSAVFDVWRQWDITKGSAEFWVYLRQPDGTTITLYHHEYTTGSGSGYALQDEDILEYMDQAGVYTVVLACTVEKGSDVVFSTKGWYDNVSLAVTLRKTKEFLDQNVFTEHFSLFKGAPLVFLDESKFTEHFTVQKLSGLSTAEERLVTGFGKKVYDFRTGNVFGVYDTDELDFGTPGEEKTLEELVLYSDAEAPHTITVYISADGAPFTTVGSVTLQKGHVGFVHPWMTGEAFKLRLAGYGFQLVSFILWAIPRGREAADG